MTVEQPSSKISVGLIAGAIWVVGFVMLYFRADMQNAPQISRWEFWESVPFYLFDLLPGGGPVGDLPSGWSHFAPRHLLILTAGFIAGAALCLGRLILRGLKVCHPLTPLERGVISLALGYASLSLITLDFGFFGLLDGNLFRVLLAVFLVTELGLCVKDWKSAPPRPNQETRQPWILPYNLMLPTLVMSAFLGCMLLGSLLPSIDFDVKEYHLQGPKEWYLAGQITFLEHNVYTSFPFLTEMLSLTGMLVYGDWFWGALVGKVVLMTFAPLAGAALYCLGCRWFSTKVGWWAMLIYLTTPWVYRVSIIAYTEGALMCYVAVTLLAFEVARRQHADLKLSQALWGITGFLAGSAMACKYPGLISVVLPISACALFVCTRKSDDQNTPLSVAKLALMFLLGGALAIGPWLLKNTIQTGNPVYPLAWSIFGGEDWNAELQQKWKDAHSPPHHQLSGLPNDLLNVVSRSDYQSLLLFTFAPLSLLVREQRRTVLMLWLYASWLFVSWWVLTHRIDRFWLPMIPVLSLLAAAGVQEIWNSRLKALAVIVWATAVVFNLALIVSPRAGLHLYLTNLEALAQSPIIQPPGILAMNQQLREGEKLLSVGEANVFDARFPLEYNTVFDFSILEEWCTSPEGEWLDELTIRKNFEQAGITHVLVNWGEILRYRQTYRYTNFVLPGSLDRLIELGILSEPEPLTFKVISAMSDSERQEVETNLAGRIRDIQGESGLITNEVYKVLAD